ncbi:MAG: lipoyl(octanoyl) transferase LipB [Candidatus Marinimicrobia bacterium]|nr:lipoyl(octanoyl) transferase LipB [Candidatus Neomarinimicrobiota bacterium]
MLEHPHVYTLGRHANRENLVWDEAERKKMGVDVQHVDRGGDVTYHGPGQLVGYPLIKLDECGLTPRRLVKWVEDLIIDTLSVYGIESYVHPDHPGVWVGDAKICAIGMRIKKGVSYHGFALNISTDLRYFTGIVPCGIGDKEVCSLEGLLHRNVEQKHLRAILSERAASMLKAGKNGSEHERIS